MKAQIILFLFFFFSQTEQTPLPRQLTLDINNLATSLKEKIISLDVDEIPMDDLEDLEISSDQSNDHIAILIRDKPIVEIQRKNENIEIIFDNKSINSHVNFRREYEVPEDETTLSTTIMNDIKEFLLSVYKEMGDYQVSRQKIISFLETKMGEIGLSKETTMTSEDEQSKKDEVVSFVDSNGRRMLTLAISETVPKFTSVIINCVGNEFAVSMPNGAAEEEVRAAFDDVLESIKALRPQLTDYSEGLRNDIKDILEKEKNCRVLDSIADEKGEEESKELSNTFGVFGFNVLEIEKEDTFTADFKRKRILAEKINKKEKVEKKIRKSFLDEKETNDNDFIKPLLLNKKKVINLFNCPFCYDDEENEFNDMWNAQLKPKIKSRRLKNSCPLNNLKVKGTILNFGTFQYLQISFTVIDVYSLEMAYHNLGSKETTIEALSTILEEVREDLEERDNKITEYENFAKREDNKNKPKEEIEKLFYESEERQRPGVESIENEITRMFKEELGVDLEKKGGLLIQEGKRVAEVSEAQDGDYVVAQFFGEGKGKDNVLEEITVPVKGSVSGWDYFIVALEGVIEEIRENKERLKKKIRI